MSDSPSPPPAPDYVGAAQAQGTANKDAAIAGAQLSNPNVTSPYGSQSVNYTTDPLTGNPIPNITQTLAPDQQALLKGQNQLSQGILGIGNSYLPQVSQQIGTPIQAGDAQQATDQAYKEFTARLDPQWAQNSESNSAQLANQGITQGSEAYDNAMRTFNDSKNDAYNQAQVSAQSLAPQTQQMDIAGQSALLNELNAIRTGAQVQTPQFQPYQGQNVAPAPVFAGTQAAGQSANNIYNAQVGAANSQNSSLYGLGGSAAAMYLLAASDRRLKSNIKRIGTHPLGIGIYEYDIFGKRDQGVMADEVMRVKPHAVIRMPSGYFAVNYGAL